MSIKEKEQKLQRLIDEVYALEQEIKRDKATQHLQGKASEGIYVSKLGKIWYKFSAKVLRDQADANYPTRYFLTDLQGNYIPERLTAYGYAYLSESSHILTYIIFYDSKIGKRFLCKNCIASGLMSQADAPIQVTEEIADLYAIQFQTDPCFLPPCLES